MSDIYDVIIAGAGPAGSVAAILLARKGYHVLLIDKQQFPREKICGDGIPPFATNILYQMGMREKIKQENFNAITGVHIVSPGSHVFDVDIQLKDEDLEFLIAPRTRFDNLLKNFAVESGATHITANVINPIIDNGSVAGVEIEINGNIKNINSRIVIGADGANSTIAKAFQLNKQRDCERGIAIRAYVDDITSSKNKLEVYLLNDAWPGYAWIFPMGNGRVNIGLGMNIKDYRNKNKNLKKMLVDFYNSPLIKERLEGGSPLKDIAAWPLNFSTHKNVRRAFDGVVLTGDAAALVNPLNGGGIANAISSAKIAAQVIDSALQTNNVSYAKLREYEFQIQKILWKELRRSYLVWKALYKSPIILDGIVKYVGNNRFLPLLLARFYPDIKFTFHKR